MILRMKTKFLFFITPLLFSLLACSQKDVRTKTLQNLTEHPIVAFHVDGLTIQGMTEKDTLFIENSDNYVFKQDDSEKMVGGYQFSLESAYRHPYFNVDVKTHTYYDSDSLIFDVYSTMEVSRKVTLKDDLKPSSFVPLEGAMLTVVNILKSDGYYTRQEKDTVINGKPYLYLDAFPEGDTIRHELLLDKQRNLPDFLRITVNTFQPFIQEYRYSSFIYPDSFEKPQSMRQPIKSDVQYAKPLAVGDIVPGWNVHLITGDPISFEYLKGRKTVFYVSMINCAPCQEAVPFMQELIEKYSDNPDVDVVVFYPYDPKTNLDKYIRTKGINYPIVYNSIESETERVSIMNNMQMPMPTFLILDENNKIIDRIVGFNMEDKDRIEELIAEKLNGNI